MTNSTAQFIGKTLAEIKQTHPDVRVVRAGDVEFMVTMDWDPARLNVGLGPKNIKFVYRTQKLGFSGEEYTFQEVDGSMDAGVVVEAHFG